jgi:hypothetical protein
VKQQSIQEKKNAEKAHGQRFLDRQRLTRQEKKIKNNNNNKDDEAELLLTKIALDQIYVAHHPNDVKYMPLYKSGKRVIDQSRQLYRRAITRKRILKELFWREDSVKEDDTKTKNKRVSWIPTDQYERLTKFKEWTIQDEEQMFGGSITRENVKTSTKKNQTEDSRFSTTTATASHNAVLKAAEQIESQILAEEEEEEEEAKEKGENDEQETIAAAVKDMKDANKQKHDDDDVDEDSAHENDNDNGSDSDSDSSDDDDDDDDEGDNAEPLVSQETKKKILQQLKDEQDSSSSSSSSSSSDSDSSGSESESEGEEDKEKTSNLTATSSQKRPVSTTGVENLKEEEEKSDEEVDDFLVDANEEQNDGDVFQKTKNHLPAWSSARGDKSKGWETQMQRPGQYKKRRTQR